MAPWLQEEVLETRLRRPSVKTFASCSSPGGRQLIFRWKISLRNEFHESRLGEITESQEDFFDDSSIYIQIAAVCGAKVLEYVFNLCRGNYDFLEGLPVPLLLYIISFLELEDIARLSQVSSRFEIFGDKTVDIVTGKQPVENERIKTTTGEEENG
ncbi:LOW QUALITY PROTEIN: F-box only protein 36 [Podargus strigoides]